MHWPDPLSAHIEKKIGRVSDHIEIERPIGLVGLGYWPKRVSDHIVGQIGPISGHIEKKIAGLGQWPIEWLGQWPD